MSYILGLDLGETSLGIATLNERDGEPVFLEEMGVRIFPDGREDKTKTPLAVKRRIARGIRRNLDRRLRRKEKLINFLIENNLISKNEEERLQLKSLNPYELRAKGLNEKLTLNELSRVLININQRRGFLSNRKSDKQDKDNSDMKLAIKETIEKIKSNGCRTLGEYLYSLQKMNNHSLLRVKPEEVKKEKITKEVDKKTGEEIEKIKIVNATEYPYFANRQLYIDEVNLILNKQSEFYPQLNNLIIDKDEKDERKEISIKDKIIDIIFYQRKLRPQEVGKCQFEDGEYRCPKASPLFQEYRILCELNNLELLDFNDGVCLSKEDKEIIKKMLMSQKEVKFSAMKKKLKIETNILFNLESEEREKLEGDKTSYELSKESNFGKLWNSINEDKKEEIIEKLLNEENEEKLSKYLKDNFENLKEEQINSIININLPDSYANLSLKAIKKLLPYLREGKKYYEACEIVYGSHSEKVKDKVYDKLPYYGEILKTHVIGGTTDNEDVNNPEKYFGKITNPTVHIGLNQLRYCVNKIIEEKGCKPEYIAIELARSLKLNKKQKDKLEKERKQNLKDNDRINEELNKLGQKQTYDNRMFFKIWERLSKEPEQRCCPYCGKIISIESLFSGNFHIEHILPFARTYDDSINNKVLACSSCNNEKGNKSPYETWGYNSERYNEIMSRVETLPKAVQWRFEKNAMQKFNEENKVLARMLTDTQYLSKVACKYLNCLYPNDNKKHIRTIPGQLTAMLRYHWGLNKLLNNNDDEEEGNIKNRGDHRHHAIDAFVVACTSQSTLNKVSKASSKKFITKTDKLIQDLEDPFKNFNLDDIRRVVDNITISYKEDHKGLKQAKAKNGTISQLHNETNYGLIEDIDGKVGVFATRKSFIDLDRDLIMKNAETDNKYIADPKIREDLQELVKDISDKQEIKQILENYSKTAKSNGTIKRIRIHEVKPYKSLMSVKDKHTKQTYKYAETNGNYCAEIYKPNRGKNKDKWCVEIISNFDAQQENFQPKWKKEEPEAKLIMRLFINDTLEIEINNQNKDSAIKKLLPFAKNNKVVVRVKKMTNNVVYLIPHSVVKEDKPDELSWQGTGNGLELANAKKIRVSPLGNISYLNK